MTRQNSIQFSTALASALAVLFLFSCQNRGRLNGFDEKATETWNSDKKGCHGHRAALWPIIANQQDSLLGMNEDEVTSILGKPDRTSLGSRNLKSTIYFVESGKQCDSSMVRLGKYVTISYNAVGLANEIVVHP